MADYATLRGETPPVGGPFATPESSLTAILPRGENALRVSAPGESPTPSRRKVCVSRKEPTDSELEPCAHLHGDRIKGGDDPFVVAGIPDHHCRTVLPITLVRQYRFARRNPLQTRSGRGRCRTGPFRKPFGCEGRPT